MHAFFATQKKTPIETLTEEQEKLFPDGLFDELPDIGKYDIREAGMCIAFERNTAAAFHVLRATESVLRTYYCGIVKRNRPNVLTWGSMINDFKKHRKQPPALILKNLEYIRENFRNPTAHPDVRYDSEGAQSVFNLCVDIMTRLLRASLWVVPGT